MAETNLTTVYEGSRVAITEDAEGRLHLTNNAVENELITPALYAHWSGHDIERMRVKMVAEGMPEELAARIVRQAEVWD
jgi:hypothetical protein